MKNAQKKKYFCTGCGEELENFVFSGDASDIEAVRRHVNDCKDVGKMNGKMCSRVFIASETLFELYLERATLEEKTDEQTLAAIKAQIMDKVKKSLFD